MEGIIFYILAFTILSSAIAVVALRNPMHSTLALIITLTGVAGIFAVLGAHFLAVAQIIVYAGAIVVLVLFVLMLLNMKAEEFSGRTLLMILFGGSLAVLFLAVLLPVAGGAFTDLSGGKLSTGFALGGEGTTEALGRVLYTKYLLPFELASILIMSALVGAVMVGRSGR